MDTREKDATSMRKMIKIKRISLIIVLTLFLSNFGWNSMSSGPIPLKYNGIYKSADIKNGSYHYLRFYPDGIISDADYTTSMENYSIIFENLASRHRKNSYVIEGDYIYSVLRNKNPKDMSETMYSGQINGTSIKFYIMIRDGNDDFVYKNGKPIADYQRIYKFIGTN